MTAFLRVVSLAVGLFIVYKVIGAYKWYSEDSTSESMMEFLGSLIAFGYLLKELGGLNEKFRTNWPKHTGLAYLDTISSQLNRKELPFSNLKSLLTQFFSSPHFTDISNASLGENIFFYSMAIRVLRHYQSEFDDKQIENLIEGTNELDLLIRNLGYNTEKVISFDKLERLIEYYKLRFELTPSKKEDCNVQLMNFRKFINEAGLSIRLFKKSFSDNSNKYQRVQENIALKPEWKKLFICHMPDNEFQKINTIALADSLNETNIHCLIKEYLNETPIGGFDYWINEEIATSNDILFIVSARGFDTFRSENCLDEGNPVKILANHKMLHSKKIIVGYFSESDQEYIPNTLKKCDRIQLNGPKMRDNLLNLISRPSVVNVEKAHSGLVESKVPSMNAEKEIYEKYFTLPITQRFSIAKKLNLLENGESMESNLRDAISSRFLLRAFKKNLLFELWNELFPNGKENNPFNK